LVLRRKSFLFSFRIFILCFLISITIFTKNQFLINVMFALFGFLVIIFFAPREVRKLIVFAFFIRIIFVLIDLYVFPLPESREGSDALMFLSIGWEWSQNGLMWLFTHFTSGAFMYSWLIALVYSFFGRNQFLIQFFNSLFGAFIVWNVYLIAKSVWSEKEGIISAYICTFFPTLIYFSALSFREVPIVFFFTSGLLFFIKWLKEERIEYILTSEISFALSTGFHSGMIWAILFPAFELLYEIFEVIRRIRLKMAFKKILAIFLVSMIIFAVFETRFGFEKIPSSGISDASLNLLKMQSVAARDRAAYLVWLTTDGVFDIIWQAPIRIIYFLFTPFIWMIKLPVDLLGFVDAVIYLILCFLIILNIKKMIRNRKALLMVIFLVGEIGIFALTTSNYGTALRHRAKFVPIIVILASYKISEALSKNNTRLFRFRKFRDG